MKTRTICCCSKCKQVQVRRPTKEMFRIKRWVWMLCEKCR
jgi:hypothetical protein